MPGTLSDVMVQFRPSSLIKLCAFADLLLMNYHVLLTIGKVQHRFLLTEMRFLCSVTSELDT